MEYIKRIIDKELNRRVGAFGAIQIIGPKGCGKTRTAKERCKSVIEFEDEDKRSSYLSLADTSPSSLLKYEKPILFDEWQDAPKIWGAIRKACDDEDHFGDFYLTGSSTKKPQTPHSGTMRISTITMYPMSLYESGDSNGKISLVDIFDKKAVIDGVKSDLSLEQLIFATCRGGWPRTLSIKDDETKLIIPSDYFEQIINVDISKIDGVKRNPEITKAILKSYARNIGTLFKNTKIYDDIKANYPVSSVTVDTYVEKLKELYVIYDVESWGAQIRSPKTLRASHKHMFVDPSIAIAALGLSPSYFYEDFDLFGHIFESLVFRDLTIYSSSMNGHFSHYHDALNLEVDGVLHLKDGRYALIEIKLGSKEIDKGIANLKKVVELIKQNNKDKEKLKIRLPDELMIITTGPVAYTKDGVKILPIGCLKD